MRVKIESFAAPLDASIAAQKDLQFTTGGGSAAPINITPSSITAGGLNMAAPVAVPAGTEVDLLTLAGSFSGGNVALILGYVNIGNVVGSGLGYTVKFYLNGLVQVGVPLVVGGVMTWGFVVNPTIAGAATLKLSVHNTGTAAFDALNATLAGMEFI